MENDIYTYDELQEQKLRFEKDREAWNNAVDLEEETD